MLRLQITNLRLIWLNVEKELSEGYWDFELIKERLKGDKINLTANIHNNTCDVENKSGATVNLKRFGELLGFPTDTSIPQDTVTKSSKAVDVNFGLKYLTVTCDLANPRRNVDTDGSTSTNIAYLPIPPGTRLNSPVSGFNHHPIVPVKEDIVTEITFTVSSKIPHISVDVDVLLNLVVNGI
jgi:hypothetical protein